MTYWDTLQPKHYAKMQARHKALWEFVFRFCDQHDPHSILEIGGGMNPPLGFAFEYHNIDLNGNADAIHGDFMEVPVERFTGVGLLLAANVIEHMPQGWEPFLTKVLAVRPRHAIINFFNGLDREADYLRTDGHGIARNRYSKTTISAWLKARKVRHQFRVLAKRDTVLSIQGE